LQRLICNLVKWWLKGENSVKLFLFINPKGLSFIGKHFHQLSHALMFILSQRHVYLPVFTKAMMFTNVITSRRQRSHGKVRTSSGTVG